MMLEELATVRDISDHAGDALLVGMCERAKSLIQRLLGERLTDIVPKWHEYPTEELRLAALSAEAEMEAYLRYQETRPFNIVSGEFAEPVDEKRLAKVHQAYARFHALSTPETIIKLFKKDDA